MSDELAETTSSTTPQATPHPGTDGHATMAQIACPICAGPILFDASAGSCLVGHAIALAALVAETERKATHALWSAVRALEDSASGARWRQTLPDPPPYLGATIARLEQEVLILRELLAQREGPTINTHDRPADW